MRRRDLIKLLGGAAAATWPRAVSAQKMLRVGYLQIKAEGDQETQALLAIFQEALKKLGWADGGNVNIDYRFGADSEQLARIAAAELVGLAPDVILAVSSLSAGALLRETRAIPIVFVSASDPVSSGLVDNLPHPGGNLTGFINFEFPMGGKWLETLKGVAPHINRVLVVFNPANIGNQGFLRAIQAAAPELGVQQVATTASSASEIETAINSFTRAPDGGLLVLPSGLENRDLIVKLAARHRLPAIYTVRAFISSGGLMSYDTDHADLHRRAAGYVDRILRGEKPGDLPVQVPTKYELVINLKVAKELGLTIPLPLLASADEVIE